jgi:hypothetical protein
MATEGAGGLSPYGRHTAREAADEVAAALRHLDRAGHLLRELAGAHSGEWHRLSAPEGALRDLLGRLRDAAKEGRDGERG